MSDSEPYVEVELRYEKTTTVAVPVGSVDDALDELTTHGTALTREYESEVRDIPSRDWKWGGQYEVEPTFAREISESEADNLPVLAVDGGDA